MQRRHFFILQLKIDAICLVNYGCLGGRHFTSTSGCMDANNWDRLCVVLQKACAILRVVYIIFFLSAAEGRWRGHFAMQDNSLGIAKRNKGSVDLYECLYCGKQYGCKHTCQGHVNKHHLAQQPYKCSTCERAFYYYSSMLRHLKTCIPFQCPICGLTESRLSLETHMEQEHHSA